MNDGLKRLQRNIKNLISAGYQDGVISYIISQSTDINDMNSRFEDELSYAK